MQPRPFLSKRGMGRFRGKVQAAPSERGKVPLPCRNENPEAACSERMCVRLKTDRRRQRVSNGRLPIFFWFFSFFYSCSG